MTFDQLDAFVQVARARSFSRAGVVLGLAQPTMSERIAGLEGELHGPLFVRHGHVVDLTEAGRALLPYAERTLALRAEGAEAAQRARTGGLGRLALGANPSCSQYLAPRLIGEFWREHAGVAIHLRSASTPVLMEALLDGTIQLALGSHPQMHPRAEILWTYADEMLLLAAPNHPLARRGSCHRADLVGQTFLATLAGPTHQALERLLPDPESAIALEATAGEVLTHLVGAGAGLTVLPRLAVWEELARGQLAAIRVEDFDLGPYEVALARWPGHDLAPAAAAFAAHARAVRVPRLLDGPMAAG